MKLPTLRQVSGLVMIVNTFLPAIVLLVLAAMTWSTASAIKRTACAAVAYAPKAMNDDAARVKYVAAVREAEKDKDKDNKKVNAVLGDIVGQLYRQAPSDEQSCKPWRDLRDTLTEQLYTDPAERVAYEMRVVDRKFQTIKREVQKEVRKVVPELPVIKPPLGAEDLVKPLNDLFKLIHDALAAVGTVLTTLGHGLTEPLQTAGEHLYEEGVKVDYKRAVALALLGRGWDDATGLLGKFGWFFVVLALWLAFSYALWVHRRLAVGWALLRNQEAA